ncbi:MAG TPA: hypothetical protein ENN87_17260 [Phycisphaerales bacterium]|nr:hypothetical protein [Phycisphaerales bacterium]
MTHRGPSHRIRRGPRRRAGVVLLFTLIVLTVLVTVVAILASRIATHKHRQQYMIDYQNARYACDSGMKYALATLPDTSVRLVERPDEPDFSDVFYMTTGQYQQYLAAWAEVLAARQIEQGGSFGAGAGMSGSDDPLAALAALLGGGASADPNATGPFGGGAQTTAYAGDPFAMDPNEITIRGPYGPPWPLVVEPIEIEVGQARVRIEIIDENAKLPLTWAITSDQKAQRAATDAVTLFCEWMGMERSEIDGLFAQLERVEKIKRFTIDPKPVTVTQRVPTPTRTVRTVTGSAVRTSTRSLSQSGTTLRRTARPAIMHTADFARLLHSTEIDLETLARPNLQTGERAESPLKYLALWGSQRVNINTAPRHVLEAAFVFGGHHVEIAEAIIQRRRSEPFKSIDELEEMLYGYATSIRECRPYLTTTSTFFSVRVTAWAGTAKASAVTTIVKDGKQVQKVAMLTHR